MITYLGGYTVGGIFPTIAGLMAGMRARLVPMLNGGLRVSGMLEFKPPSAAAQVAFFARALANAQIKPPVVKFNLAANASLVASLQAQFAVYARLLAAFGQAGIDVYLFSGPANTMGGEVQGALGNGLPGASSAAEHVDAFVIATRYPAAFNALRQVLL